MTEFIEAPPKHLSFAAGLAAQRLFLYRNTNDSLLKS